MSEVSDLAAQVAAGLLANGVAPGERVLLMMRNIPDFHWLDDPEWGAQTTYMHIEANYQLLADNLMDPSHVAFYVLDVSGHGAAAAMMSMTLHRALSPPPSPTSVLVRPADGRDTLDIRPPGEVCEDLNILFGSYPPGGAATAAGGFSSAYREHFGEAGCAPYLAQTPLLVPAFDAVLRGEVGGELHDRVDPLVAVGAEAAAVPGEHERRAVGCRLGPPHHPGHDPAVDHHLDRRWVRARPPPAPDRSIQRDRGLDARSRIRRRRRVLHHRRRHGRTRRAGHDHRALLV